MQKERPELKTLVIIPAFNEEETIGDVISSVNENFPEGDIVVINDGSWDSTPVIARKMGVLVLDHPYNMGIGATMQTGYKYAARSGYDIAVQVDADGQHPAESIKDLVDEVVKNNADIVVGSRFLSKGEYRPGIARGVGIFFFSKLVSLFVRERITDPTSGFRASGRRCIEFFSRHYPDDYPEVEALVLLHKKRFVIMEVPVKMRERAGGKSSITPVRSVYYMVKVFLAILIDMIKKV